MFDVVSMYKSFSALLPWLIGAILLVSVWGFFWVSGWAIVVDETQGVQTAVITNSGGAEQKLHRLWNGFFYTIPQMDGVIEVRCADGTRKQWGYVPPISIRNCGSSGKRLAKGWLVEIDPPLGGFYCHASCRFMGSRLNL
ncbi:hypothetical protein [Rhizobium herbae]|uniref:NusG domain-containing protein n=1 Tax=Rhizobium herbae TaxID=508661 RepID=A0ABS4EKG8_9HYPH|nr:hypothetical protein [Rhizobium herbae]MBP1858408.1 hypothetical protein [Rhizobium herbae]